MVEHPAFLIETKRRYAQPKKYLFERMFTLVTDHKSPSWDLREEFFP